MSCLNALIALYNYIKRQLVPSAVQSEVKPSAGALITKLTALQESMVLGLTKLTMK